MTRVQTVQRSADVVMQVEVSTPADPTGDPIEWAFTQGGAQPTSWTVGAWVGSYASGKVQAISPLLPSATSTVTLAPGRWTVWVRWSVGSETPVEAPFEVLVL
jgi:hypothetical protein